VVRNDLQITPIRTIKNNIINTVKYIIAQLPSADVIFSSILPRRNIPRQLHRKRLSLNRAIAHYFTICNLQNTFVNKKQVFSVVVHNQFTQQNCPSLVKGSPDNVHLTNLGNDVFCQGLIQAIESRALQTTVQ